MKDWKFAGLWAFMLISGELILYGRYYILFYKPYIPFKLVRAEFYRDSGIFVWHCYFTIQYVGNDTLEDVRITWADMAFCENITIIEEEDGITVMASDCKHTEYLKRLVHGDTFIVSSSDSSILQVEIAYHKTDAFEIEEVELDLNSEDAQETVWH